MGKGEVTRDYTQFYYRMAVIDRDEIISPLS